MKLNFTERQVFIEVNRKDLSGQFTHNLDQKNRLAIPSKIREDLGEEFKLCFPMNGERCLFGYAMDDWYELMDKIDNQEPSPKLTLQQRLIHLNSVTVTLDKQGRVTIPTNFMEKAGFSSEVFILGSGRRVELWCPEEWEKMQKKIEEEAASLGISFAF